MLIRRALKTFILIAAVVAIPATAAAQRRAPHADSGAVGGDVGVLLPRDSALSSGPILNGFYEYYVTARDSVRMRLGWANPSFDRESSDKLRHVTVSFDVVHNWEGGSIHPFVGTGIGVYFLQERDNGQNVGDSSTKVGGILFGGAEFFTSNTVSVKGEASYHIISNVGALNPDGLALSIGLKKYF